MVSATHALYALSGALLALQPCAAFDYRYIPPPASSRLTTTSSASCDESSLQSSPTVYSSIPLVYSSGHPTGFPTGTGGLSPNGTGKYPFPTGKYPTPTGKYPTGINHSGLPTGYPTGPGGLYPNGTGNGTTTTSSRPPMGTGSNSTTPSNETCFFWYDKIPHRGIAAFNPDSSYSVYRNVKDFGAKGDGRTDDTDAIQNAISSGNRVSPLTNSGSTTTLAVVYFPPGDYLISKPIVDYFYTQLIGNPNCMPVIRAAASFVGGFMIDGDPYASNGQLSETATNLFFRQVRNMILDLTDAPPAAGLTAVHWPTGQATSLQNLVIKMSEAANTAQVGVLIESGSGGFAGDLVFAGGKSGMTLANQQFTMRNLSFTNTATAITQSFNWGWTFQQLYVKNASIAINMTGGGSTAIAVGAVNLLDSTIDDTPVGILTAHSATSMPPAAGGLNVENVILNNVPQAIKGGDDANSLAGTTGSTVIQAWSAGHRYVDGNPDFKAAGPVSPQPRDPSLLAGQGRFYTRAKPEYADQPLSAFLSARSYGAVGDGVADDTAALTSALRSAANADKILFVEAGTYRVTSTIDIPSGSRVIGEGYAVIMSSGRRFGNADDPVAVLRAGKVSGEPGHAELVNLVVSTQSEKNGAGQAGAKLIEWNFATARAGASGLWDVHTRVSGFTGSNQQLADCPITNTTQTTERSQIPAQCLTAFMSMHVTRGAAGLLMENNWLWTSDHDIDTAAQTQITVYTGRGLLVESAAGRLWLYGTAVEHHALYQYQFAGTRAVVAGQIQTESPYWLPNPTAAVPFAAQPAYRDPVFPSTPFLVNGTTDVPNANSWGARFLDCDALLVYGMGLYSFFDNYKTDCDLHGVCQSRILDVQQSQVYVYDYHVVGTTMMLTIDGEDYAPFNENVAGFTSNIGAFRVGASF